MIRKLAMSIGLLLGFGCQVLAQDTSVNSAAASEAIKATESLSVDTIVNSSLDLNKGLASSEADTMKIADDQFLKYLDSMMTETYLNHFCFSTDTAVLNYNNFSRLEVPKYSVDEMTAKMKALDDLSPIDLDYNSTVQSYIDLYTVKRKMTTSRMLGMSQTFFPIEQ